MEQQPETSKNIVVINNAPAAKRAKSPTAPPVQRVAAYCRVSTAMEAQEDSYALQCAYYADLISRRPDMSLVEVYGDQGLSGTRADKRPAFQRMIQDCEAGRIDLILCKSVSRFSRNLADAASYVHRLKGLGIPVIFERENLDTSDATAEMVFHLLAAVAQQESNSLSHHRRWAERERCALGQPTRPACYGYRKTRTAPGQPWYWHIHPEEAAHVRRAFRMAVVGCYYREIAAAMPASTGRWTTARLRDLLTNEAYQGDLLTGKTYTPDMLIGSRRNRGEAEQFYIQGHHEPIIDRDTFQAVQRRIASGDLKTPSHWRKKEAVR